MFRNPEERFYQTEYWCRWAFSYQCLFVLKASQLSSDRWKSSKKAAKSPAQKSNWGGPRVKWRRAERSYRAIQCDAWVRPGLLQRYCPTIQLWLRNPRQRTRGVNSPPCSEAVQDRIWGKRFVCKLQRNELLLENTHGHVWVRLAVVVEYVDVPAAFPVLPIGTRVFCHRTSLSRLQGFRHVERNA